jgi:hypothetical protein
VNDRRYRVCFVTADEAEHLNRNGKNELARCCGHLDCFHSRGRRDDGGEWSVCLLASCGCTSETPPDRLTLVMAAQDAAFEAEQRALRARSWFFLGVSICAAVWAAVELLR